MSSYSRRLFLFGLSAGALSTAGCIRPMLAKGSPAGKLQRRIELPAPRDRFGYYLEESLSKRLGRATAADFRLTISRKISERGVAIAQDNSATRITLLLEAEWQLVRLRDGTAVLSDKIALQSGYNATTSLYATRQTRRDIERRLARDLGNRIARAIQARAGEIAV